MSITIESDLKEILTRLEQKIDTVQKDVSELKLSTTRMEVELKGELKTLDASLKGEIKSLDASLKGEIKSLDEKVVGFGKRLENQEFVSRGILLSLVIAILGGFAKLFGFVGNP
jgi:chromosome segregation ATPase